MHSEVLHHYKVDIVTEFGEKEVLSVTAVSGSDAEDEAREIVSRGIVGMKGTQCKRLEIYNAE